ncbi:MAG: dUTP diphosphatase [Planctomycetota bacterium]|nr:dUTP diphosphatase [Planctomycetota bacterium]
MSAERPTISFQVLSTLAVVPQYQTEHAAGMDIHAAIAESITLRPHEIALVPSGLAMEIPVGFEAQIRPRSGLSCKHGITVPNAPGTIDADYRGEVKIALINLSTVDFTIEPGMRIAQMVVAPVAHATVQVVASLSETARGTGGFGSTGHR